MDIVLIRHGETIANVSKVFGDKNTMLTKKGLEQARNSKWMAEKLEIDKVLVSPYIRAIDTMNCLGLDGEIEEELREISSGILEGYSYVEFEKKYPEHAKNWSKDSINYRLPNSESVIDLYNRIDKFLDILIQRDEDVVLICHDGVIRAALCTIFEDPNLFFRFKSDNLGFTKITIDNGYKYINYMNRIHY